MILNKRLSNSDVREHVLDLIATDAGSPPLSSRATLRIDVRASALEQQWLSGRVGGGSRSPSGLDGAQRPEREGRGGGAVTGSGGSGSEREGLVLLSVLGVLVALMSLLIAAVLFVLCRSRRLQVNVRAAQYQQKQQIDAGAFMFTCRIDDLFLLIR